MVYNFAFMSAIGLRLKMFEHTSMFSANVTKGTNTSNFLMPFVHNGVYS